MRNICVTYGRQFTGGVFAGVSMHVRAVRDDLGVLIGQQLRGEFLDSFGWNVQRSGNMGFAETFGRERLDHSDVLIVVELGFQVFRRDCVFHTILLATTIQR
jgi:hypothetical protein